MKSVKVLVIGVALIVALINISEAQKDTVLLKKEKVHSLEFSFLHYLFDYKEDVPFPLKSTEHGFMIGSRIDYFLRGRRPAIYVRLGGELTRDYTRYDGTYQSGEPVKAWTRNVLVNFSGNIGYKFQKLWNLTNYTGFGIRFWERGGQYREHYQWFYLPLGIRSDYKLNKDLSGSFDISARIMFEGKIYVYMSDYDTRYNDFSMNLGNLPGAKLELPIYFKNWIFTPWYEYSAINPSDWAAVFYNGVQIGWGYEPASTTHQIGLNVGRREDF